MRLGDVSYFEDVAAQLPSLIRSILLDTCVPVSVSSSCGFWDTLCTVCGTLVGLAASRPDAEVGRVQRGSFDAQTGTGVRPWP